MRRSLCCQTNALLLANLQIMLLNPGNQLRGGPVYGFQTGTEFFQLLALGPCGNVAEAVVSGFNAEILADGIGNALRFHFFGIPVLFSRYKDGFAIICQLRHFFIVVELGMGHFVNGGADGLHLAHTFPEKNRLFGQTKITVHAGFHRLDGNGHLRCPAQSFHENLILRHIPGQAEGNLRQGFTLRLSHIEYGHHLKHGDGDFLFLCNGFPFIVQHGQFGVRVQLLLLLFYLIGGGSQYLNPFFAFPDMTPKAVLPLAEASHQRSVRALGVDQHNIVQGILVEPAHGGEVIPVAVTLEQLHNAFFDTSGDLFDALLVGLFFGQVFALLSLI